MIQRIEHVGPPPSDGERRGDGDGERPGQDRATLRIERLLIAAVVVVGATFGAAVVLRHLSGVGRPVIVELPTAVRAGEPLGWTDELGWQEAVSEEVVRWDVDWLAAPERQGRDTPSAGLRDAQLWAAHTLESVGAEPVPTGAWATPDPSADALPAPLCFYARTYRNPGLQFDQVPLEEPDLGGCLLEADGTRYVLGSDYVPLASSSPEDPLYFGKVEAPLVFAGFGIDNADEGYDDFAHVDIEGRVALVLAGEPAQGFAGREVTAESSVWNKVDALAREGAVGALVVSEGRVDFRASRASWNPPTFDRTRAGLPTLVVSSETAERLLGANPRKLAIRSAAGPLDAQARAPLRTPTVRLEAKTRRTDGPLVNVVGLVPGRTGERVFVVCAHLDHIGVGPRGRIGYGGDDNASGAAAALALLRAIAHEPLDATVLFLFPSGEEDGLLGSRAFAADLPTGLPRPELCVNLDMIGHGSPRRCIVLRDAPEDALPALDAWLESAAALDTHGLERIRRVDDRDFFQRSDHYAFHEVGIPAVFLFEEWPHTSRIYHTWLDDAASVDAGKVARVARFALEVLRAADRTAAR